MADEDGRSLEDVRSRFRPKKKEPEPPPEPEPELDPDDELIVTTEDLELQMEASQMTKPPPPDEKTASEARKRLSEHEMAEIRKNLPDDRFFRELDYKSGGKADAMLRFGKFKGQTVSALVGTKRGRGYLRWVTESDFPERFKDIITNWLND